MGTGFAKTLASGCLIELNLNYIFIENSISLFSEISYKKLYSSSDNLSSKHSGHLLYNAGATILVYAI